MAHLLLVFSPLTCGVVAALWVISACIITVRSVLGPNSDLADGLLAQRSTIVQEVDTMISTGPVKKHGSTEEWSWSGM